MNIDDDKLKVIKTHVSHVLPGVDSRIVMEYMQRADCLSFIGKYYFGFICLSMPLEYPQHPFLYNLIFYIH